jgi:hypothetical protein
LKKTAKFSSSHNDSGTIRFCDAKLLEGEIMELSIHAGQYSENNLKVIVQNGVFWSQYWTIYKKRFRVREGFIWTTKKQSLTLYKRVYGKGDVIKGRLEFECLEEPTNPKYIEKYGRHLTTIKMYGVFKTLLK